jgi:hypothetical protein
MLFHVPGGPDELGIDRGLADLEPEGEAGAGQADRQQQPGEGLDDQRVGAAHQLEIADHHDETGRQPERAQARRDQAPPDAHAAAVAPEEGDRRRATPAICSIRMPRLEKVPIQENTTA